MADDIVTRLREHSPAMCGACDTWGQCGYGEPCDCRCHMNFCQEAADEIERLRVAGDVIAGVLAALVGDRKDVQRLLDGWEEARCG